VGAEYESFLRLALPEPQVILGQELRPLSIGHLLFLDKLSLLPATSPEQLVLAILVCTRETADIIPTLQDRWLAFKIHIWLMRFSPFRKIDWTEKVSAFCDYISDGTETPSAMSLRDDGKNTLAESGTPFLQHLKTTLQAKLNYSPAEALDCPYVQAIWDFYTHHEIEGNVLVCDREHRQEMKDQADRNHAALVAEAVKKRKEGTDAI